MVVFILQVESTRSCVLHGGLYSTRRRPDLAFCMVVFVLQEENQVFCSTWWSLFYKKTMSRALHGGLYFTRGRPDLVFYMVVFILQEEDQVLRSTWCFLFYKKKARSFVPHGGLYFTRGRPGLAFYMMVLILQEEDQVLKTSSSMIICLLGKNLQWQIIRKFPWWIRKEPRHWEEVIWNIWLGPLRVSDVHQHERFPKRVKKIFDLIISFQKENININIDINMNLSVAWFSQRSHTLIP